MKLDGFLTQGLIESLNNGLIVPELIVVYAGNYLAKSLITADEMTQIQNAVTAYKPQKNASASNDESPSTSESTSTSATTPNSETTSNSTSTSESTSTTATASEKAASN